MKDRQSHQPPSAQTDLYYRQVKTGRNGLPFKQGLYDPQFEKDACGVGFVVNIKGKQSHEIVEQGLTILRNLDHRGARGSEHNTGDGAGILMQVPHKFFARVCAEIWVHAARAREYGVGMLFMPKDAAERRLCEARFEAIVREEGQELLGLAHGRRRPMMNWGRRQSPANRLCARSSLAATSTHRSRMTWRSNASSTSSANAPNRPSAIRS